ncbi:NAD-P-binding protein [Trametes maxima]|nr:NAD-P-binding protein [Trametes maxima]
MSSTSYTVTIVGGTGGLGQHVSRAFLTEFQAKFGVVRVLTRDPSSAQAQELAEKGAILYKLDESNIAQALDEAFRSTDVVVNTLPTHIASENTQHAVIEAAARSSAKVYFLSEYGLDYYTNDFPGYDHPLWLHKKEVAAEARKQLKGRKVIALFTSVFTEWAFMPVRSFIVLGVDAEKNAYDVCGPPNQKFSLTSIEDIGRAIASLSVLALDPSAALNVPDAVRIAGYTTSFEDIRDTVARVKDVPKGVIKSKDLAMLKESLRRDPGKDFAGYMRVLVGEGKGDFSAENDNELVNPAQSFWRWKTVDDYVREL